MVCLILYWYTLLWNFIPSVQEMMKALLCFFSTMELGAELVVLIVWLLDRKGVI